MDSQALERAVDAARAALSNAYCPYSGCHVGAAVKAEHDSRIFAGCNVENASFSATICAERSAVTNMVGEIGHAKIELVVVVTEADPPWPPCGVCRQVLAEFADDSCPLFLVGAHGMSQTTLGELLPRAFRPDAPGLSSAP